MQTIRLTTAVLFLALGTSAAHAERAWQGSICLVDVNMLFHFDGYDHGDWSDLGLLRFPGRSLRGPSRDLVSFRLLPSEDDPLSTTIKGSIEIQVDRRSAKLDKLDFVRPHRHADWRIDPKIIEKLERDSLNALPPADQDSSSPARDKNDRQ